MNNRLTSFDISSNYRAQNRDLLARLAWYEGLQLLPQHLQAMDDRVEGLLFRQMSVATPLSWGLDRLALDQTALQAGILRILNVAGQFSDGTVFSWDDHQSGRLETLVRAGENGVLRRYAIAMPLDDFTADGVEVHRYRQIPGDFLADRNNRSEKAAVARWIPNLSICEYDTGRSHLLQIPFIDVERSAGGFEAGSYHPPAARLLRESDCRRQIVRLIKRMRAKASQLESAPLPLALSRDHKVGLMPVFSAIAAMLPKLEAQLYADVAKPYDILLNLCEVAGMLSALTGKVPDLFPAYDHTDLARSLLAVSRYIEDITRGVNFEDSRWHETPFVLSGNRWTCPVVARPEEDVLVRVSFRVSDLDASINTWIDHALVAWDVQEAECRNLRVRGLRRTQGAAPSGSNSSETRNHRYLSIRSGRITGKDLVISAPDPQAQVAVTAIHWLTPPRAIVGI